MKYGQKLMSIILFSSLLFCLIISSTYSKETLPFKEISAPELKAFMDNNEITVINVLSELEHDLQNIKGSQHISFHLIKKTSKLPKDKNKKIAFYCMGVV